MTGCAPAVNVALPSASVSACVCIPCSCTELHPATREPERECITSPESSSGSRVDGSRFRLALSNDPPLSCHSAPLGLSLITSLSVTSCSLPHPPTQPSLPPVHPSPPLPVVNHCPYLASGVTLNSGPAAMCPTTRADVDEARPMHEAESKESREENLDGATVAASSCHLPVRREAVRISVITAT